MMSNLIDCFHMGIALSLVVMMIVIYVNSPYTDLRDACKETNQRVMTKTGFEPVYLCDEDSYD